jgi:hypothetical protein
VALNIVDLKEAVRAAGSLAEKLTVYRLSPSIRTLLAVTPAELERFPGVSVDEIEEPQTIAAAIDAILRSEPEPGEDPIDVRFGLVFSDRRGERVLSVYKGRFALSGLIDEQLCDFNEFAFDEWLTARYT